MKWVERRREVRGVRVSGGIVVDFWIDKEWKMDVERLMGSGWVVLRPLEIEMVSFDVINRRQCQK
jgi:hypothetical protein